MCDLKILQSKVKEKVVFITGGTSGLGFSTAQHLFRIKCTLILGCLNECEIERTKKALPTGKSGHAKVIYMLLDLSNFRSVVQCANDLRDMVESGRINPIDFLVNNAGCARKMGKKNEDGIEYMMAVNCLGHLLLTRLLIEKLEIMNKGGSVVSVASDSHKLAPLLCYSDKTIETTNLMKFMKGEVQENWLLGRNVLIHALQQYGISKLCVLWGMYHLHRLYFEKLGIRFNSVQPGAVNSSIVPRDQVNWMVYYSLKLVMYLFFRTPSEACQTTLHCMTLDENDSGKYYAVCKEHDSSVFSLDQDEQERFWSVSDEILRMYM